MKKLLRGYLAHPVLSREKTAKFEREFEIRTGIDLVNPFTEVERELNEDLNASEAGDYSSVDPVELVDKDLAAVLSCDFLVAFVTGQRSYGTIMEICYAYSMNKPVFIICENGHENHPWLVYHSNKIFTNTRDFRKYIQDLNDGLPD
jgi:nucleoside 2-deoxyribosyltransferase